MFVGWRGEWRLTDVAEAAWYPALPLPQLALEPEKHEVNLLLRLIPLRYTLCDGSRFLGDVNQPSQPRERVIALERRIVLEQIAAGGRPRCVVEGQDRHLGPGHCESSISQSRAAEILQEGQYVR